MKIFYKNTELLDIIVNDESYRYRAIRGEHNLTLYFSLAEHVEIPVGAYCEYQNERFTLYSPANLKMQHSRSFEYTIVLESAQAEARMLKFRNPVDGRLKFSLTATPFEFLEMLISNMERNSSEWSAGDCINANPKTISFNHASCSDALSQIADEFGTEYEFEGRTVSLHKVEHNRDNPLELSYGKGNGFKPGIGRTNYSRQSPIGVLYVQGGSRNIVPSRNGGAAELLLPKSQTIRFDGVHFEDETGFDSSKARTYITDDKGMTIRRTDPTQDNVTEESLDCTEIYPSRIGSVSDIRFLNSKTGVYYTEAQNWSDEEWKDILIDIIDKDIPESLDYNKCIMEGEKITVIFQDGMLAGKEFDAEYFHESKDGRPARRFEIVQQEIDGMTMPGGNFRPSEGQKFAVLGCSVPETYICDNETKSGASWEMFRKGVRYLYENEEQKFTFSGQLDGIWAKNDWLNIGGKIRLGGFVQFTDSRFQQAPVLIRITGIKDYVNNPHSPEIELSNSVVGHSLSGALQKIESNEVSMEERHKEARQFTKRRFRDSQESIAMLKEAIMSGFSDSVSPLTVQTMMALIGDKSLQFRFVDGTNNPNPVSHDIHYDNDRKALVCEEGIIQHMTLGVKDMSPVHGDSEYRFWQLPAFESPVMDEPDKGYYLYAKVSRNDTSGKFYLSDAAIPMEPTEAIENIPDWQDCYFLLVGLLGSEQNGERSYSSWYGFTEISPGQVMTDKIISADGNTYFDLAESEIGGRINLTDGAISGAIGIGNKGNIKAGMSGVGDTDDSVRIWAGTDYNNRKTAPFKVTQKGELWAENAHISGMVDAKSGTIGGFTIGDTWLQSENKLFDGTVSHHLSSAAHYLSSKGVNGFDVRIDSMLYPVPSLGTRSFAAKSIQIKDNKNGSGDPLIIGLSIDVSGAGPYMIKDNVIKKESGCLAICCHQGQFAGFRPTYRNLNAGTYKLSALDHSFTCYAPNDNIYIYLPDDAETGQEYEIVKHGYHSNLSITSNKNHLADLNENSFNRNNITLGWQWVSARIKLNFDGYWWYFSVTGKYQSKV